MLDGLLRPHIEPVLNSWAGRVVAGGLTPNKLTLIGFGFGIAAGFAVAMQIYLLGLLLILLNRFFDGLAGAAAKSNGITPLGSYLDIICDFLVMASFVFLFSLGVSSSSLAAAFVIFSYLSMAVAYLAFTTFWTRDNLLATPRGGLVENTEVILFMIVCCIYPAGFPAVGAIFGLLCFTTAAMRVATSIPKLR